MTGTSPSTHISRAAQNHTRCCIKARHRLLSSTLPISPGSCRPLFHHTFPRHTCHSRQGPRTSSLKGELHLVLPSPPPLPLSLLLRLTLPPLSLSLVITSKQTPTLVQPRQKKSWLCSLDSSSFSPCLDSARVAVYCALYYMC